MPSVVLPCGDDGLELVARHRQEMEAVGHRPIEANDAVVLAMLDKWKHTDWRLHSASAYRVRCRSTHSKPLAPWSRTTSGTPVQSSRSAPTSVQRDLPGFDAPKGAMVLDDASLRRHVEPMVQIGLPVLVTEFIPGADDRFCSYYSFLDDQGAPLFSFTKRKLRQFPPRFGGGTTTSPPGNLTWRSWGCGSSKGSGCVGWETSSSNATSETGNSSSLSAMPDSPWPLLRYGVPESTSP